MPHSLFLNDSQRILLTILGVQLAESSEEDLEKYEVAGGVKIVRLVSGKLSEDTEIKVGFVIAAVNGHPVNTIAAFIDEIKSQTGGIMLQGKICWRS